MGAETVQILDRSVEMLVRKAENPVGTAVLCHPHPLYGGSMYDGVLSMLDAAMPHFTTVRFNFRGVGNSSGEHDQGIAEVADVRELVAWLNDSANPPVKLLGGYSFGAVVAMNALNGLDVEASVLVAPPVGMGTGEPPEIEKLLVILGERDNIVDANTAETFFATGQVVRLAQADHFFGGADAELQGAVEAFLNGT